MDVINTNFVFSAYTCQNNIKNIWKYHIVLNIWKSLDIDLESLYYKNKYSMFT